MFWKAVRWFVVLMLLAWPLLLAAQDVPPPEPPAAPEAPLAPEAPSIPPELEGALSKIIRDPLLLGIAIAVLSSLFVALRRLVALLIRRWGAEREERAKAEVEMAKATSDAKDDEEAKEKLRRAHSEHELADKVADIVEKPKG